MGEARRCRFVDARPFVLWGSHPRYADGMVIRLTGGTSRECRAAARQRHAEGGWSLGTYAEGEQPTGLRELVEREQVAAS